MTNTVSAVVSDETLSRIIQIESGGNPNAKAKTSSASGLGQFLDATWQNVVNKHHPRLFSSKTRAEILALRFNPAFAIEMLARFTEDNIRALGPSYDDGDLYLAHFAGVGTAAKILHASGNTPISLVMELAAIRANKSILQGKSCGQVRAWAESKMEKAGGKNWVAKFYNPNVVAHPDIPKPQPIPQPSGFWQRLLAALQRKA